MSDKSFPLDAYKEQPIADQVAALRLRLNATVTQLEEFRNNTFISIDFQGTDVAAGRGGKMSHDKKDKRGYYLEGVDISIRLDSPHYYVKIDGPQTTMDAATISSSSQLDLNLSLGTFGPVPTTGASTGMVIGSAFSSTIEDWRVENISDDVAIQHNYRMAACGDGARYNQPKDLVDMSAGGQMSGAPLHEVPHISIANMPLVSSGIFVSRSKQVSDVKLLVDATAHLAYVEKTFEVFDVKIKTKTERVTWSFVHLIPVSEVKE
ncbi:hypothetical protein [Micromonospora sp. KC213]|uniref:hypothetical protein n=1 Tax=Micromonospora sp. KC213 TaxID=2530378 RepID=UPI00104AD49C|nr:hypothetical protein [Micromonospora sp. KC213]TDC38407.1 hypothetical protein E1166_18535 [Micromonospora sp. KC213]